MRIIFPKWVETTKCDTVSYSVVATGGRHGAEKRIGTFSRAETVLTTTGDGRLLNVWKAPKIANLRGLKKVY